MNPLAARILARHDANESVATIAAAEAVSFGHVYTVLREHRPGRSRQPRTRTSEKRKLILGLLAGGIAPPRVAFLAECTPTYVYKLAQEEETVR
jgi:hypothetical protein